MTAKEIREASIDSAKVYYEYLEQNDKGVQVVDIADIEYPQGGDALIKLRLSAKLFDTEAIFFRNLRNNEQYDTVKVRVLEYDNDKNILLIKPDQNIREAFWELKREDLKIIADLKFLVQRVKAWYELNGAKVALPTTASKYSCEFQKIQFFNEEGFQPSDNQKESLKNIFTNPFSYVWGAPGTGKTQIVLSYAVVHYAKKRDRIAILAPTNNALEQVLRGVLKMTDKAAINRKQVLRLGIPSKKFAEEYPEVCEELGVYKQIHEIDKQLRILERMQTYRSTQRFVKEAGLTLEQFDRVEDFSAKRRNIRQALKKTDREHKTTEIEVTLLEEEVATGYKSLAKQEAKVNSFANKLIKTFSSKPTAAEQAIAATKRELFDLKKQLELHKFRLSELDETKKELIDEKNALEAAQNERIENIKAQLSGYKELGDAAKDLSPQRCSDVKKQIVQKLEAAKEQLKIDAHLFPEYSGSSLLSIEDDLRLYKEARERLKAVSTEERLKTVNVIACTLDGYISRYTDSKLNVAHIFLDEAGYANMVKALTLFTHPTPITFLGDHMQLPPVCEINDSEMERDAKYANMFLWAQAAIFLDTLFACDKDACKSSYLRNLPFRPSAITKTSLNATFRFGNNLAQILAKYVYDGDFCAATPTGKTKISYINAPKREESKSRNSMAEVQEIRGVAGRLKRLSEDDFMILTPYKKQVRLLSKHLPQERNDLKIQTVHGSQGREWDTVILSVVDTADMWFVDTANPSSKGLNLVNTAVSRAKKQLIIVCDAAFWLQQKGQMLADLLRIGEPYA